MQSLYKDTHDVLNKAVQRIINGKDLPENYLIPHREKGEYCPQCEGKIKRLKVSSRDGY
ncbi:MAG: hypothetical protein R6U96_11550 [Promethearchaeia archaeon]